MAQSSWRQEENGVSPCPSHKYPLVLYIVYTNLLHVHTYLDAYPHTHTYTHTHTVGAGVKAPNEMKPVHHQLHLNLSQRHHPPNDTSTASLSQNETFSAQWEQLAGHLGLTEADVEHCREHGCGDREEACHQMLRTWKNRSGSQASVARLADAVLQIRDYSLLELLNDACTQ